MQYTTYMSPLPLSIFFSGERSTLVSVKHKSSHQIFHFCGLVVDLFSVLLAVIRCGVPLVLPLCRSFQYLGLLLERFIRYGLNIFSSLNFTLNRLAHKIEQRLF